MGAPRIADPVEVDETYIGGRERHKHSHKKLRAGRGPVGKTAVAGAKDRSTNRVSDAVVPGTDGPTLRSFVTDRAADGAMVYTDDVRAYLGLSRHEAVRHGVGEYVREQAHTNGIESFWALLKRGYQGTYHHLSPKHLDRYITEFEGRRNDRPADTIDQMRFTARRIVGKRLTYGAGRPLIFPPRGVPCPHTSGGARCAPVTLPSRSRSSWCWAPP